jgi:energy-coupling factor transporter ATP-binding protein EcfA2
VALARALAVKPNILLLDEPFAALDKNLRLDMQIEIKRIQRLAGTTTVLVTHDQEEALSMADRVAVLNQGRLEQYAPRPKSTTLPNSLFVNTFVGSANTLPGKLVALNGEATVALDIGGENQDARADGGGRAGAIASPCACGPSILRLADDGEGLAGIVEMGLPLGPSIVHEVRTADGRALKVTDPRAVGSQPRAPAAPCGCRRSVRKRSASFPPRHDFIKEQKPHATHPPIDDDERARARRDAAFPRHFESPGQAHRIRDLHGKLEEAHRDVLVPAYRKATSNAEIVLDPMLSVDQIAKVTAARANPPIDRDAARSGPDAGRDRS